MGEPRAVGMSPADREALTVLLSVHGMGPLTLARLVERLGSPAAILEVAARAAGKDELIAASRDEGGAVRAMPEPVAKGVVAAAADRGRILADIARQQLRVLTPGDREYPGRLLAIELPPPALFVRGTLAPLAGEHVVAIVGTRRPSPAGRRVASRIAASIARAGAVVVSGLAIGIDGVAHAACVTERRPTVAFIGGGHAALFPRAHDRLADAIVDRGGAVVSEYAPSVEPTKGTFPQRNRLISGASDAVVVVEAGARSGALVTASWALEQGRECFIVPGSIDAPMSAGCNGFLRDWPGLARIVSGVPQLLDDLGLMGEAGLPAPPPSFRTDDAAENAAGGAPGSAPDVAIRSTVRPASAAAALSGSDVAQQKAAEMLRRGATTVDEIVAATGLTVAAVLGALTRLEAAGLVQGRYGRYEPLGSLAAAPPGNEAPAAA